MEPTPLPSGGRSGDHLSVAEVGRLIDQLHLVALELMPYADDRATVAGNMLHVALRDLDDVVRALEVALASVHAEADERHRDDQRGHDQTRDDEQRRGALCGSGGGGGRDGVGGGRDDGDGEGDGPSRQGHGAEGDVEGFVGRWLTSPCAAHPAGTDPIMPETEHLPMTRTGAMEDAEQRLASVWAALARARRPEADAVAAAGRLVIDSNHATDARPYP